MTNEKELAEPKPLIELVDLGSLRRIAEGVTASKGSGCTPPTQTPAS